MTEDIRARIAMAIRRMTTFVRDLPEWRDHPRNRSGSVSAHFGPTILSEHDCVLHFARLLVEVGFKWEDLHLELSPGQWMFRPRTGVAANRNDLALVGRDRLASADLPVDLGDFALDAVFEFALASNYWQFGAGSPRALIKKVDADIAKVEEYLESRLATLGYVVVIEECDHQFPPSYVSDARTRHGVDVLLVRQWC
jgi:hypothetical protein